MLDAVNHWFVQGQDCFFVWMSRLVNQETDWLAKGGTSFMGYLGHLLPINSLGLLCIWCVEFGGPCCWFLIFSMFKVTLFLHPISFLLWYNLFFSYKKERTNWSIISTYLRTLRWRRVNTGKHKFEHKVWKHGLDVNHQCHCCVQSKKHKLKREKQREKKSNTRKRKICIFIPFRSLDSSVSETSPWKMVGWMLPLDLAFKNSCLLMIRDL